MTENKLKLGDFFAHLSDQHEYSNETRKCIENTVLKLSSMETTESRPGILLGKIQSGKTRTFIGIIGLAFDNGYDIAIVLTKGTRALAEQTYQRLNKEFLYFLNNDKIQIFDILNLPDNLVKYELNQKMIIVVKKEVKNLERLNNCLFNTYPNLALKRILMIDDEADFASIGFKRSKDEGIEIRRIAGQIDKLRKDLGQCDFLQVTATPYSLYLQPEDLIVEDTKYFKPIRPAFTELVPVNNEYIGSQYYFKDSEEENSIASYLYEEVAGEELGVLKSLIEECLKLKKL